MRTTFPEITEQICERWQDILITFDEIFPSDLIRIVRASSPADTDVLAFRSSDNLGSLPAAHQLADRNFQTVLETRSDHHTSDEIDESAPFTYVGLPIFLPDGTLFGALDIIDLGIKVRGRAELRLIDHFRYTIEDHLAHLDATEKQQRAEAELRRERDRLELATMASGSGIWDYNIDDDLLHCDERWHSILGLDPATPITSVDQFKPYIHPDDVERATEVNNTLAKLLASQRDYHINFRIVRPDGEIRWVRSAACIVEGGEHSPTRAVGAITDVTEQVNAATTLAASEARFRALADTVPQTIFSATPDGTNDYVNRRFFEFTGASVDPITDEIWQSFLHPEDRERVIAAWYGVIATDTSYDIEYRYRHCSGEYRWVRTLARALLDEKGMVSRWFGSITDIHEAKLLEKQRELVALELDHRVQNIFALVDSLIGLSLRDDATAKPFAYLLRERLIALNIAHNLIRNTPRTMTAQSLHGLVGRLLKPYEGVERDRIWIEGDDTLIRDGVVTGLALVFHELATNAAKYGALNAPTGKLALTFNHDADMLRVAWRESGVASVARTERDGFGSKLLDTLIRSRMQGTFARKFTNDGMNIDLLLPLKIIQADV